jgi:hypothetical protein
VYLLYWQYLPVERCAELLADLLGGPVSTGWLCQIQLEAVGRLRPFILGTRDGAGTECGMADRSRSTQAGRSLASRGARRPQFANGCQHKQRG